MWWNQNRENLVKEAESLWGKIFTKKIKIARCD